VITMWRTKLCLQPGCGKVAEQGADFCAAHKETNYKVDAQHARNQAAPWRLWYGWAIWRNLKAQFFNLDPMNAVCVYVDPRTGQRCTKPAEEVDHIIPHCGNWDLFTDLKNLQGLCHFHHSQKTAREDGGFGNCRGVTANRYCERDTTR